MGLVFVEVDQDWKTEILPSAFKGFGEIVCSTPKGEAAECILARLKLNKLSVGDPSCMSRGGFADESLFGAAKYPLTPPFYAKSTKYHKLNKHGQSGSYSGTYIYDRAGVIVENWMWPNRHYTSKSNTCFNGFFATGHVHVQRTEHDWINHFNILRDKEQEYLKTLAPNATKGVAPLFHPQYNKNRDSPRAARVAMSLTGAKRKQYELLNAHWNDPIKYIRNQMASKETPAPSLRSCSSLNWFVTDKSMWLNGGLQWFGTYQEVKTSLFVLGTSRYDSFVFIYVTYTVI